MRAFILALIAAASLMAFPSESDARPWRYQSYYGGYYSPYYGGYVGPRVSYYYGPPRYYYRPYSYGYYW